ncbi:cysteine and histidine-rich domain-containing protein RAR1 isoform X2 [Cucumis sativus]|uniref:cysteine and histidine-rich domain-containing protein RAR1 isoform X2 n=1 Tax=Cucumis sativus TaxID=3659 RepID=UPI0005EC8EA5|nr:cysteine and histidine-rich domain-containing protein RAR1 isoform X2 [Cucumis sativus]KAE8651755.1 hypothetical protein Csa_006089 [Cucumis sativus]
MEHQIVRVPCQRIGCNALFTEDDNPEGSCQYHDSPIFHDGMKEWSCCKKRSHDFSLFLEIPGCKTGKHTTEKPVLTKPTTGVKKPSPPSSMTNTLGKELCARCQQGFFCSDHGTQIKGNNKSINETSTIPGASNTDTQAPQKKKKIGMNEPQICKNKGCGKTFTEMENHDTACSYHPGPPVFHDRMRGWQCCNIHVKEFDEFMDIAPCSRGWHNAGPA